MGGGGWRGRAREPIGCSGWAETGRYIGTISRWHVATCRTDCNLRASIANALHARTYTYVHPLISRIPWIHPWWPLGLTWLKMVDVAWRDSGYVSAVFTSLPSGMETHLDYGIGSRQALDSRAILLRLRGNIGE